MLWTTSPGFFCSQGAAVGRRLGAKTSPVGSDALGCRVYPALEGRKGAGRSLLWQWWEVGSEASDLPDPFIPDSLFLVPLAHKAGPLLLDLRGWEQRRPSYGCLHREPMGASWEGLAERPVKKCHYRVWPFFYLPTCSDPLKWSPLLLSSIPLQWRI